MGDFESDFDAAITIFAATLKELESKKISD